MQPGRKVRWTQDGWNCRRNEKGSSDYYYILILITVGRVISDFRLFAQKEDTLI